MIIDVLVAEIGSTTTVVNAFNVHKEVKFIGQGFANTTVNIGNVNIGLTNAIEDLKLKLNITNIEYKESFACSSAAGGLKMSVHGLIYDMTVKAAREAALGAGANIHLLTSGLLSGYDINKIKEMDLNIIMVAGGVNFGENITALENARKIANLQLNIPVIYAGNIVNHDEVIEIFKEAKQSKYLYITENVYPGIDELNVEPSRKIIQDIFEKHITEAPGMGEVRKTISENIIPTPAAVLHASKLVQSQIGDLLVIDVGGATTDIHSVTQGSIEVSRILVSPEPFAKRTVEGDLGVYINKESLLKLLNEESLINSLGIDSLEFLKLIKDYQVIPNGIQIKLVEGLTKVAITTALTRHAGQYQSYYGASGKTTVAKGRDLTNIQYIIGTGGPLTRFKNGKEMIDGALIELNDNILKPSKSAKILIDHDYNMATLGVLSIKYPKEALTLITKSLKVGIQ
jgi:uncharacterized protein (TIGR01319 family)